MIQSPFESFVEVDPGVQVLKQNLKLAALQELQGKKANKLVHHCIL